MVPPVSVTAARSFSPYSAVSVSTPSPVAVNCVHVSTFSLVAIFGAGILNCFKNLIDLGSEVSAEMTTIFSTPDSNSASLRTS